MDTKNKNILNYRIKLIILAILALMIIVAPSIKELTFISDYYIHLIGIFFGIGIIGFILNRRFTLLLGFGFCALISLLLKNDTEEAFRKSKKETGNKISSLLINLADIRDPEDMFESILKKDPDVISFTEFTPDWNALLTQNLGSKYQYHFSKPSADFYGKAFYSRLPIINTFELGTDLSSKVQKGKDTITIYTTYIHPLSDESAEKIAEGQFKIIIRHIQDNTNPCLVLGQFNQVYWSPQIKNFKVKSGLKNCRNTSLPQFAEVQKENSFHNGQFICDVLNDFRMSDNTKTGIFCSYYLKTNKK